LAAEDWPYPVNTVFNPAATYFQKKALLPARAEDRRGFSHFTKAVSEKGVVNWMVDTNPTFESDPENYPEEAWGSGIQGSLGLMNLTGGQLPIPGLWYLLC